MRLSIQKERKEKFEAKIVLENLRNFVERVKEIKDEEKPYLFQYLIKDIIYGRDEIGVNLFYLPNSRANLPAQNQSGGTARATAGGEPVSPSFVPSYLGLKNRSKWLHEDRAMRNFKDVLKVEVIKGKGHPHQIKVLAF